MVIQEKRIENKISMPTICLGMFLISMFCNPDPYFGIADHYIFLCAYILIFFLCNKRIIINNDTQICIFMIGWLLLSCVVPLFTGDLSSGYALSYFLYALTLLLVNGTRHSKKNVEFFLNSYILSAVIICALIVVFRYDYYGSGGERITIKIFGNPAIDPNHLGAYLVVPFTLCYGRLLKKFKWMNCVATLLVAAGMFSTASRGAMLAAFMGVFVTTFLYLKKRKKQRRVKTKKIKVKKILIIAAVILICCIVVAKYVPINSLIRLFNFSGYDDASNSKRFANWLAGLQAFFQRPLFGYGPRGEMGIIEAVTGMSRISHSTYIAALIQFGSIGVLLFGVYICYMLRKNKNSCTVIGSIVATLVVCVFVSAQVAVFLWVPLIMASIVGNYEEKDSLSII